jgi:hypothetical protein
MNEKSDKRIFRRINKEINRETRSESKEELDGFTQRFQEINNANEYLNTLPQYQ